MEKEELAKVNDEWEYIDRTFDTESKILNVKRKKKEENNESTVKANFEIKDENTLTIVDINEAGSEPFWNEETKKILSNAKGVGVNSYFIHEFSKILISKISRKKQMWMAPVNTNLPGESIANEVSNVDIVFNPKKNTKSDLKKMIQKEKNVSMKC